MSNQLTRFGKNSQSAKLTDSRSCSNRDLQEYGIEAPSFSDTVPLEIMEQIIYFRTKLAEIVFDPFAGTGVTADACKMMSRRFFCSDLFVFPGREKDIKQWDVTHGLPPGLPDPDLVILDPPYPKQPDGEFSKPTGDLSRMNLVQFSNAMRNLLGALRQRKVSTIAILSPHPEHICAAKQHNSSFDFDREIGRCYEVVHSQHLLGRIEKYGRQSLEHAGEGNHDQFVVRHVEFWQRQTP